MTVLVPTLTRAGLLRIAQWTAANERARREYERDPFAASRLGTRPCFDCRRGEHFACTSQAHVLSGSCTCFCYLDDHTPRRTR